MPTLIFGKVFASMFTGSMYGAGAHVFAVMTYVIANMQPSKERVEYVRLNPQALSHTLGEPVERIEEALKFLTDPDPASHTAGEDGRRLVMESPFVYRVVNGQMYREMKDEEDRLAKDAVRSHRYRERKTSQKYLDGERRFVKAMENGDESGADEIAAESITNGKAWEPNPEQLELNRLFNRKASTRWSAGELKAWRSVSPIDPAALESLSRYYSSKIPNSEDFRRHDLATLLNNFNGEVDRARNFKEPKCF